MSDRPMHTVPGLLDQLTALYAEGERASAEGRLPDAEATFTRIIELDDDFRQRYVTAYARRAFTRHRMGRLEGAVADYGATACRRARPKKSRESRERFGSSSLYLSMNNATAHPDNEHLSLQEGEALDSRTVRAKRSLSVRSNVRAGSHLKFLGEWIYKS